MNFYRLPLRFQRDIDSSAILCSV